MSQSSENTAASQDEDPATLTHQGKPNCTVTATTHLQQHKQRQKEDQSQLQDEHGEIANTEHLQTKIDLSPYGHYNSQVRNHLYGVDENLDSITLVGFGSLLTKILFSYRSTEVSGTLIVMKVPTERSRSWGRRAGKTATL